MSDDPYALQPGASVGISSGDSGAIVSYRCSSVFGDFERVPAPYFYDFQYPCLNSIAAEEAFVETTTRDMSLKLLQRAALAYRILPSGDGCFVPPTKDVNWVVGVSSTPAGDSIVTDFGCQRLIDTVPGECCVVVQGGLEFVPSGDYDETAFKRFVAEQLNDAEFSDYNTAFIGSEVEFTLEGDNPLPPAISSVDDSPREPANENKVTVMGGFVIFGLCAVVFGALFIVFRRRSKRALADDIEGDFDPADDFDNSKDLEMLGTDETLQLDVLSDEMGRRTPKSYEETPDSQAGYEYTFDLGSSLKNDVMGTYGSTPHSPSSYGNAPSNMRVTAPYPMSETSDSEADSWAQTDGTVGSLEDHLEEITAEI
jgi:hypothetical protein